MFQSRVGLRVGAKKGVRGANELVKHSHFHCASSMSQCWNVFFRFTSTWTHVELMCRLTARRKVCWLKEHNLCYCLILFNYETFLQSFDESTARGVCLVKRIIKSSLGLKDNYVNEGGKERILSLIQKSCSCTQLRRQLQKFVWKLWVKQLEKN